MVRSLLIVMALGSFALAQPGGGKEAPAPTKITSEPAKVLVRALMLAGVKSTKAKAKTTFAAKALSCRTKTAKDPFELDVTECEVDGKKLAGAAAFVLEAGMQKAGIPSPYRMAETLIQATSLTCLYDKDAHNEDGPFVCTYTAAR